MAGVIRTGILTALLCLADMGCAYAQPWKKFHSNTGFSVEYPAPWQVLERADCLHILSDKRRAEGVIIAKSKGMILVCEAKGFAEMNDTISYYINSDRVLSQNRSRHAANSPDGRRNVIEVETRDETFGRGNFEYSMLYFCELKNRRFVVAESNWQDDKHQHDYRLIAKQIVQTIRLLP
jgi:hypothetical protein